MTRLQDATSPYLLLHKDNPVNWYTWGPEAFAEAEATGKPIFLSIGYTGCHWCHVMNDESFSKSDVAQLMNDKFVNIIVDREERPDIDQVYQAAANTMGHNGGWPLNIFLNSKGQPYYVGSYLPPEPRDNLPAFKDALDMNAGRYHEEASTVASNATQVTTALDQTWNRDMRGNLGNDFLDNAAVRMAQRFDLFFGGMTGQVKFANTLALETLWRAYLRTGIPAFAQFAGVALDHVLLGGLRDHVGGGFYRYCNDERWTVPHYEKMLVDNALILDYVTLLWQHNRNTLCRDAINETVAWMLREMKVGDAFASSLAPDSEGEEGKYYLWTEAEIDAALQGTFVQRFKTLYNIRREGNLSNGKNILHRVGSPVTGQLSDADQAMITKQHEALLKIRQKRVAPMRDDKVLCDANAYAIYALANAGMAMNNQEWIAIAVKAFDFIVKTLGDGDRLYHSWRDGKRMSLGFADDYASMARAALLLNEITGDKRYIDYAKRWTTTMNQHYWNEAMGGYCFTADDAEPLIVRTRMIFDQPAPSANATMMVVLGRLHLITGEQQYFERAQMIAHVFANEATRVWQSMPAYFNALEQMSMALQIVVIGPPGTRTREMVQAAFGRSFPNRLVTVVAPDEPLPPNHPAFGKTMQNGVPTAYICQRNSCSPPVVTPVQLSQILQLPQQQRGQAQAPQAANA
ncbi:MAG TPA: thioredoxin domain-containing protein [Rhizomicrobium sp.]|jgi:hypothetical protein|nr:thioredoxin domain-containing protein [Rhizomicrobium sp.]